MDEQAQQVLEVRSRALFKQSVENIDMPTRSRLTQARHAALAAAESRRRFTRRVWWMPAAGVTAAAVLGVSLWTGTPTARHSVSLTDAQSSFEDLEIVAAVDDSTGDAMDMLQDDIDFYDFADKAASADTTA